MQYLESDRARQQSEYDSAMARVLELGSLAGTDNLDHRYDLQGKTVEKYANEMDELSRAMLLLQTRPTPNLNPEDRKDPPIEEIAKTDPYLAQLLNQKASAEQVIRALKAKGYGAGSPELQRAENQLTDLNSSISIAAEQFRHKLETSPDPMQNKKLYMEQLKARVDQLKELKASAHEEWLVLGKWQVKLEKYRGEAAATKDRLDRTIARIDELKTEERMASRVEILSEGERPLKPDRDTRSRMAGIGGIFGLFLGAAALVMLSCGTQARRQ
jgi:uncharacterized protein involved in exopolysaccharide biosynthesis